MYLLIILLCSSGSSSGSTSSGHHHDAAPTTNPAYFSTSGAFNGTGIALATESFGQESYGTVVVYFQHWTGQIRNMQLSDSGDWVGGDETTIVATDARNGTPIAAVAYAMNHVSTVSSELHIASNSTNMLVYQWHIFYVDTDNTLQEVINGNTTNHWELGPLGSFGFKAMDDINVGLQGCWAGYRPGGQMCVSLDLFVLTWMNVPADMFCAVTPFRSTARVRTTPTLHRPRVSISGMALTRPPSNLWAGSMAPRHGPRRRL